MFFVEFQCDINSIVELKDSWDQTLIIRNCWIMQISSSAIPLPYISVSPHRLNLSNIKFIILHSVFSVRADRWLKFHGGSVKVGADGSNHTLFTFKHSV